MSSSVRSDDVTGIRRWSTLLMYLPSARRSMLYFTVRAMCSRIGTVVLHDVVEEHLEVVELDVAGHEVGDDLDARRAQLGTDVDEHDATGEVGPCQRDVHRDPPAHRVAHDHGRLDPLVVDERERVGGLGVDRVVLVARPLGVAVTALVEREHVIAVGEVQAHEVPRVRRLVAAVQQQDLRRARLTPLREVEAQAAHHRVARHVPHVA